MTAHRTLHKRRQSRRRTRGSALPLDKQPEIDKLKARLAQITSHFEGRKKGATAKHPMDAKRLAAIPRIVSRLRELGVQGGTRRRR